MPTGVFRIGLEGGGARLARGDPTAGPRELLPAGLTLDDLLGPDGPGLSDLLAMDVDGAVPVVATVLAPIESQEVWAAGVTDLRSREARAEESVDATPYDLVYEAERPELFFKAPGWRVRGPGEPIAIRADSPWNVPEAELALVLDARMRVAGFAIGNDVSSRSIEGENPLYVPQAKVYDGSCGLGPCIVPAGQVDPPFAIALEVRRGGRPAFGGTCGTELMRRSFHDLAAYLGRALTFPVGAVLLTGTGLVPDPSFSLAEGDEVRISIEGLGVLANVVAVTGALG